MTMSLKPSPLKYRMMCACASVTRHLEALIEAHLITVMTLQAVHFGCQCSGTISTLTFAPVMFGSTITMHVYL